jgi:hypothetical protein
MPTKHQVNTGDEFGRLTVVCELPRHRNPSGRAQRVFSCLCECGNFTEALLQNLRSGNTTSCGCAGNYKHGHSSKRTATYMTWNAMRARCHNPKHSSYQRYGGAGITVCPEWLNADSGFAMFLSDMGERPRNMTLDRIDNTKGYCKSNCRWATAQEQYANKRVRRDATGKFI